MEDLVCYNTGCGQTYKQSENHKDSCRHHPGGPVFHDALKGWSCCKKRSCDFTEFLSIPGCTYGFHSNVKPEVPAPEKKKVEITEDIINSKEIIIRGPEDNLKPQKERPSEEEPMVSLQCTVGASLKTALERAMKEMKLEAEKEDSGSNTEETVAPGASCKNNGCNAEYIDESSNNAVCVHHPGFPVFHEGMKYWSCCQRKTSEFDKFLAQEGCTKDRHLWLKKEDPTKQASCRLDWHQTSQFVTISVFAKTTIPDKSFVKSNQVVVRMGIVFEGGKQTFSKRVVLKGRIDPSRSNVKLLGSKVEINLRKADPGTWSALELQPPVPENQPEAAATSEPPATL